MPKSKPRAGAVAKVKRSRQQGSRFPRPRLPDLEPALLTPGHRHRHEHQFAVSPWAAWRDVQEHLDATAVKILELLPFHLHGGRCSTMTDLAAEVGSSVQEWVVSMERLEEQGLARWDGGSQTIVLFTPDDRPLLQMVTDPFPTAVVL